MKFGLLYEMEAPRPWSETSVADCFWEALDQVKVAEEVGFTHVFSVEHHFLDEFSVAAAPEVAREAYRERDIQELIDRHSVIVGGPQRCIESIAWYEAQGVDMMLFLVQAGSITHADIIDSLRRFGREVMPHFARASH